MFENDVWVRCLNLVFEEKEKEKGEDGQEGQEEKRKDCVNEETVNVVSEADDLWSLSYIIPSETSLLHINQSKQGSCMNYKNTASMLLSCPLPCLLVLVSVLRRAFHFRV